MRSTAYYRGIGAGFVIGVTHSGDGVASAKVIFGNCIKIVTGATAADETITVKTPFALEVLDVRVECTEAAASATIKVLNDTDAITDAMSSAAANEIARNATLDDAYVKFAKDADDLVIKSESGSGDGEHTVYITFS